MSFLSQTAILDACRILFGDEVNLGPEFLGYLQPSGAKSAFRIQAKLHHPDHFADAAPEVKARQTERFCEIHQAYNLLSDFLARRHHIRARTSTRPFAGQRPDHAARPARATPPPNPAGIPPLPIEFGIYLYYRGKIDYRNLIEALVWQRRQRPALGIIACQWGWLTEEKVRRILGHRVTGGRFGRKAVELGLLSPLQIEVLLRHQRSHQRRLGQYFVDRGLMTAAEAEQLARDLERHNARCAAEHRR
jgi:curved DNA-binding protein CbpA